MRRFCCLRCRDHVPTDLRSIMKAQARSGPAAQRKVGSAFDLRVESVKGTPNAWQPVWPFELLAFPSSTKGGCWKHRKTGRMIAPVTPPGWVLSSAGWLKTRLRSCIQISGAGACAVGVTALQSAAKSSCISKARSRSLFFCFFKCFAAPQLARQ